jgi:hypothetical protein
VLYVGERRNRGGNVEKRPSPDRSHGYSYAYHDHQITVMPGLAESCINTV